MNTQNALATAQPCTDGDEINLLELLVVIAENLKLLILGPIIAGLAALGFAFYMTPTYESVSIMQTNTVEPNLVVSLTHSADVLQSVAKELQIAPDVSHTTRLSIMQQRVRAAVGRQDKLVTLTTRASTPQQAQQLNLVVLQHVYPLTKPMNAQRIEVQIKTLQEDLKAGTALAQSIAKQLEQDSVSEGSARLYAEMRSINAQHMMDIVKLQGEMEGLSTDNLVQQATLPDKPTAPKKSLIAAAAGLVTGMALLIFVFIRQAMRNASQNPEQAETLRRLRAALGIKA